MNLLFNCIGVVKLSGAGALLALSYIFNSPVRSSGAGRTKELKSSGITPRQVDNPGNQNNRADVSILVLVDVALQLDYVIIIKVVVS